jgi:hypothetical protein
VPKGSTSRVDILYCCKFLAFFNTFFPRYSKHYGKMYVCMCVCVCVCMYVRTRARLSVFAPFSNV